MNEDSSNIDVIHDKNPFRNQSNTNKTHILNSQLIEYPFKSLNRILDDIKWTIPMKQKYNYSILNNKPIDYSNSLANLNNQCEVLILNENLDYCKSVEKIDFEETKQTLYIIRGLIIDKYINHFRISILEDYSNPFANLTEKHQYHIIPKDIIGKNDAELLSTSINTEQGIIDEAYFKSYNSSTNQLLNVTITKQEFTKEDFESLTDETIIKQRYLSKLDLFPNLSPENIPHPSHCLGMLIKILKGPILKHQDEPTKRISLINTVMETQVDVNLLLNKLGFEMDHENEEVIPPNLNADRNLRESYIRRVLELIYFNKKSRYDSTFTFSDNMSQVFSAIVEYDKLQSITNFNKPNKIPAFINLSCCQYFPDDLIIKFFVYTVQSDVKNSLHYVDSLKVIKQFRNSTKIDAYLQNHPDLIGYEDFFDSMRILGISVDTNEVDDDIIIAMYRSSYQKDPRNYQYYNNHLKRIAKVKQSERLSNFIETELKPIDLSLQEVGIEEITEDDVVITAYEFKLDDILQANNFNPNSMEILSLNKALLSVAVHRRSYLLLDYIENKLFDIYKIPQFNEITTIKAYEILNVNSTSSIFDVIQSFQNKYLREDVRILRYAMKLIAEDKKSEIIHSFLKTGKIDSSLLPTENWPAGLDNIGNTCYLNSLLQYYFCIKPLRELILNFKETDSNDFPKDRTIGGRKVEQPELLRSNQFMYQLKKLFEEMIHTNKRCVQPSKELAYLSFLPLSQPVEFKKAEIQVEPKEIEEIESTTEEMSGIEENKVSDEEELIDNFETTPVLSISDTVMQNTIEVGTQQDVTESIENVTYQIETALPPTTLEKDGEQIDFIKELFHGKTKQIIQPLKGGKERISIERFFSLIINISEHPKSIYDALDYYFNEDLVKLDEGEAKKSITITELPKILQFHVQRVMFDREKLMAYKSIEPIPFSDKIYLDRYLDTGDEEIISKRNEVFKWKREINELQLEKDEILKIDSNTSLSIIDNLKITKKYLESKILNDEKFTIEFDTIQTIQNEIEKLENRLTDLDEKMNSLRHQIDQQFIDYKLVCYSIFAVFIHRGEASYGHYWIYIKDPHNENIFRKYNDEIITTVPASEVYNFVENNTATPYYIVYVKDELELDYIEPLKRVIKE
ncbi:unnamed protein product [Candida verbasci]|uniref:Ubiquitin carboxyl-terminal hydrolase 2 n=1 Tax=Candida verbasci TaxID=1227364 RepID=A0A9W4TU99_9ASCO|nr:unnamed protein product [Candida verbasci]